MLPRWIISFSYALLGLVLEADSRSTTAGSQSITAGLTRARCLLPPAGEKAHAWRAVYSRHLQNGWTDPLHLPLGPRNNEHVPALLLGSTTLAEQQEML